MKPALSSSEHVCQFAGHCSELFLLLGAYCQSVQGGHLPLFQLAVLFELGDAAKPGDYDLILAYQGE